MWNVAAIILITLVTYTKLCGKINIICYTSGFYKRIIESISVERCYNSWSIGLDEICKSQQHLFLWWLIINCHMAWKLLLWRIIKFLNIMATKSSVYHQKCFTFIHQWNHHDNVFFCVWEFQRIFWCFNIVRHNFQVWHWLFCFIWVNLNSKLLFAY